MMIQEQLYCFQLERRSQQFSGMPATLRFRDQRAMKWNRAGGAGYWVAGTTFAKAQPSLMSWLTEIITVTWEAAQTSLGTYQLAVSNTGVYMGWPRISLAIALWELINSTDQWLPHLGRRTTGFHSGKYFGFEVSEEPGSNPGCGLPLFALP